MRKIGLLIVCLLITYSVGFLGSLLAGSGANSDWYNSVKPGITPPNVVFPIVWNVLFLLIAISLWLCLKDSDSHQKKKVYWSYGFNFLANILWSWLYFGMHNPGLAFFDIWLVFGSIIWMMSASFKINEKATWLLVPYLIWVSFASVLNYMSLLRVI